MVLWIEASSQGGWGSYVAPMDNTRIDPSYLARGGSSGGYHQKGGIVMTGNGSWEPREKALHVDAKTVDMSYTPSVQLKIANWIAGGLKRITDPSTDLSTVSNGDTVIWMDGGIAITTL